MGVRAVLAPSARAARARALVLDRPPLSNVVGSLRRSLLAVLGPLPRVRRPALGGPLTPWPRL
eukprot:3672929-Alexandrium_andersonii.AAC.1